VSASGARTAGAAGAPDGHGGLVGAVLARAEAWLVEPARPAERVSSPPSDGARPVVAVFGLAGGCGATVVARALGAELGAREDGAAALSCSATATAIPLAAPAASGSRGGSPTCRPSARAR
jgi:hypothetical protein